MPTFRHYRLPVFSQGLKIKMQKRKTSSCFMVSPIFSEASIDKTKVNRAKSKLFKRLKMIHNVE